MWNNTGFKYISLKVHFALKSSWLYPEKYKTLYINGMILSVTEILPADWARVGILMGITEALTTEDVATHDWNY